MNNNPNTRPRIALVLRQSLALALFLLLAACQTAPSVSPPRDTSPATKPGSDTKKPPAETILPGKGQLWDGVDPAPAESRPTQDLWERLRRGYALQPGDLMLAWSIRTHVRWYQDHPGYVQRTFERARPYLFDIVQALEQEHMPLELALLPAVESAFQPSACSPAKACGLWQFITPTAERFQLKQHMFADERLHIRASTVAAVRYLKELHRRFGDFNLALAAFNCGEGCVEKSVRKAQANGLEARFQNMKLPDETTQYVPRFLALVQIVANPAAYGLALPEIPNAPYFSAAPIATDMDVTLAANLAGMSMSDFLLLNPQHKTPLIVAASSPNVFVPVALAARFTQGLSLYTQPMSSWTAVQVSATTSVEAIAFQHEVEPETIRAVNAIAPKRLVQAGSTLLVPRTAGAALDIPAQMIESATLVTIPLPVETPPAKRQARGAVAARKPAKQHQAQKSKPAARRVV